MNIKFTVSLFVLILFSIIPFNKVHGQNMDKQNMAKILGKEAVIIESTGNSWQIKLKEVTILIIIDESADRMRMISPAALVKDLKKSDYPKLMEANYHSALDARYSINGDYVWSTYIHPLKALGDEELISAMYQVRNLVLTYGTSYSSTSLVFGAGGK